MFGKLQALALSCTAAFLLFSAIVASSAISASAAGADLTALAGAVVCIMIVSAYAAALAGRQVYECVATSVAMTREIAQQRASLRTERATVQARAHRSS